MKPTGKRSQCVACLSIVTLKLYSNFVEMFKEKGDLQLLFLLCGKQLMEYGTNLFDSDIWANLMAAF